MSIRATEQQPFLVYKSGAGSGKTYTLVLEYLKIVLHQPSSIRNVLAITFTNAAAAEMKQRIIAALGMLSGLAGKKDKEKTTDEIKLLGSVSQKTGLLPSEVIRNARLALTQILHNYADFSISTIDSFAHRVIRSFAFDLRLPLNFDVELDQDQLLGQAIDILISTTGKDPEITRLLVEYIESRTDEEKSHFIEYDMAKLAKTLMDEKGNVHIDSLRNITLQDFTKIHKQLTAAIAAFENQVQKLAASAKKEIELHNIPIEMFYRGKTGIGSWFTHLANGRIEDKIIPNSYVLTTIADNKWAAAKADTETKQAVGHIKEQLTETFLQIQELAEEDLQDYKVHKLVRKHLFPMAVLCELERVLLTIKSENAMLHISDFNKKISEIVVSEPAPFIYERIGERYEHYMIDEFQDTSGLQWQNLLPLITNSLASGKTNLVVGDGKQAIYRWRNGDVEQFASLPELPDSITAAHRMEWVSTLKRYYKQQVLNTNWRSRPQIVAFNNQFFDFAKNHLPESLAAIYSDHQQEKHPSKTGGYVQIDFIGESPHEELSYYESVHKQVLQTIKDLKANQHPENDMTILCRSNSEASGLARFLLEKNVNVISSESLLLSQSSKIRFILSIMKLVHHPNDQIAGIEVVQFLLKDRLWFKNLHQALASLGNLQPNKDKENSPVQTSEKLEQFLTFHGIAFSFEECRYAGVYELGEIILRTFFDENEVDPFISFFMDMLFDYDKRFIPSLSDFLEWWEQNHTRFSVVVPEGIDAVQVMTIHKSKGLQFPVVIYPFADKDFSRPGKEGEWVSLDNVPEAHPLKVAWMSISSAMDGTPYQTIWENEKGKTLLDLLNITYVAFTRAIDKLFILTKLPASGKFSDKNMAGFLHQFLINNGMWHENQYRYTLGENTVWEKPSKTGKNDLTSENLFPKYPGNPWSDKIAVRSRQWEAESDTHQATERGLRMHSILEKVNTEQDVDNVIQQLILTGQESLETAALVGEKIRNLINHTALKEYFKKGVNAKNECGMFDSQGRFMRADRVVFYNRRAVVLDYKTGKPDPEHQKQINRYASVIKKMGFSNIKKYLVYLDTGMVEEIIG